MALSDVRQNVVGTIKKNERGDCFKVTSCFNEKTGAYAVDIREFYLNADGEESPTKKGIRVSDEKVSELVKYIFASSTQEAKEEIMDALSEFMITADDEEELDEEDEVEE